MSPTNSNTQTSTYEQFDDPLYLTNNDQPYLQLTSFKFDGTNFINWKRELLMALIAKNKDGFINGVCVKPATTDKKYNQWKRCDLLVLRWILNSIEEKLRENVQYSLSSKELWIELVERYGQLNALELYQFKKELSNISQDNTSLLTYYGKMKRNWEDIDSIDPIPECLCGAMNSCTCQLLKRLLDRETHSKLIQLLMGLNSSYEHVKTHVLSMDPLPPMNKALGLLQKIETQKHISESSAGVTEVNAYHSNRQDKRHYANDSNWKKPRVDKDDNGENEEKNCIHCFRNGHKIEDCWRLKTCPFCNTKGHIQEHCYKYKAYLAKKGKRGARYASGNNAHQQPINVQTEVYNEEFGYEESTPLDNPSYSYNKSSHRGESSSHSDAMKYMDNEMVQGIVSNVVDQVIQAFSGKSSSGKAPMQSVNFAGPFK